MESGRATLRNMRSKCRCSYVLQFAFRHAVSCVLHRPPSQVIHCTVLFHNKVQLTKKWPKSTTDISGDSSSRGGRARKTRRRAKSFERLDLTQSTRPPAERLAGRTKWSRALAPRTASGQRQTSQWPRDEESRDRSLCKARSFEETVNDPSAGSPTETLLRLLLPLNAQVWESFRVQGD